MCHQLVTQLNCAIFFLLFPVGKVTAHPTAVEELLHEPEEFSLDSPAPAEVPGQLVLVVVAILDLEPDVRDAVGGTPGEKIAGRRLGPHEGHYGPEGAGSARMTPAQVGATNVQEHYEVQDARDA